MGGCGESGRNPGFLLSLIPSRFSFFKKRKCRKPGGPCNRVARRVYPRGQEHVGARGVWGPQHDPARARGRRPSFRLALLPGSPRALAGRGEANTVPPPRPLSRPCCPRGQVASPGRAALKKRNANDAAVPGRLRDSKATEPARQSEATARETPASRCCGPGGGARRSSGLWPPAPPRGESRRRGEVTCGAHSRRRRSRQPQHARHLGKRPARPDVRRSGAELGRGAEQRGGAVRRGGARSRGRSTGAGGGASVAALRRGRGRVLSSLQCKY